MFWDILSDIIVAIAILAFAAIVFAGLYQLIKRKSLKKVDREISLMAVPAILLLIVYVVFESLIILNTRPNGSGEPSFPSTHTMITATIFFCIAVALPKYIKSKTACIIIDAIMLILLTLLCFGRVLADMHWVSDVLAGLSFSLFFAAIYYLLIQKGALDA